MATGHLICATRCQAVSLDRAARFHFGPTTEAPVGSAWLAVEKGKELEDSGSQHTLASLTSLEGGGCNHCTRCSTLHETGAASCKTLEIARMHRWRCGAQAARKRLGFKCLTWPLAAMTE
jgi:hypothetical protein